jgi:hypothetical protein
MRKIVFLTIGVICFFCCIFLIKKNTIVNLCKNTIQKDFKLEVYEVWNRSDIFESLKTANDKLSIKYSKKDIWFSTCIISEYYSQTDSPFLGVVELVDTIKLNNFINDSLFINSFDTVPIFLYGYNYSDTTSTSFNLYALKNCCTSKTDIDSNKIGYQIIDKEISNQLGLQLDVNGAKRWLSLTKRNKGKSIAIALNRFVVSCPGIRESIGGGRLSVYHKSLSFCEYLNIKENLVNNSIYFRTPVPPVPPAPLLSTDLGDCTYAVESHINSQRGKEINYIQKVGGKYIVNIIDVNYGGSYSATIYTDSDCNVTSVNISR